MNKLEDRHFRPAEVQCQLDQAFLDSKLETLKSLELNEAVVSIYVAKTSTSNKNKRFVKVKRLKVHNDDKGKFRSYVMECINAYEHIYELRAVYTTQDNRFFFVEKAATDLSQMEELLTSGELGHVQSADELNEFNAYVIQLTFGEAEESVFAFRYLSNAWSLKKTSGKFLCFTMIQNDLVVTINTDPRFQITSLIDFLQFKDDVFIADIKQFETAMNFHERLIEKKTESITALCASPAIDTAAKDPLAKVIGTDKHLMRQLASVYEKGFYKNEIWLAKLRKAADEAGNWKIRFNEGGKILIEESKEYVKELLTLLQNKRVKTVVDGHIFDVDGELIEVNESPSE